MKKEKTFSDFHSTIHNIAVALQDSKFDRNRINTSTSLSQITDAELFAYFKDDILINIYDSNKDFFIELLQEVCNRECKRYSIPTPCLKFESSEDGFASYSSFYEEIYINKIKELYDVFHDSYDTFSAVLLDNIFHETCHHKQEINSYQALNNLTDKLTDEECLCSLYDLYFTNANIIAKIIKEFKHLNRINYQYDMILTALDDIRTQRTNFLEIDASFTALMRLRALSKLGYIKFDTYLSSFYNSSYLFTYTNYNSISLKNLKKCFGTFKTLEKINKLLGKFNDEIYKNLKARIDWKEITTIYYKTHKSLINDLENADLKHKIRCVCKQGLHQKAEQIYPSIMKEVCKSFINGKITLKEYEEALDIDHSLSQNNEDTLGQ